MAYELEGELKTVGNPPSETRDKADAAVLAYMAWFKQVAPGEEDGNIAVNALARLVHDAGDAAAATVPDLEAREIKATAVAQFIGAELASNYCCDAHMMQTLAALMNTALEVALSVREKAAAAQRTGNLAGAPPRGNC